jgi:phosphoglycolate phosphatase-like HAD superfamily hydrolase
MPLDIPRIRAICFDVDGTLRDTDDQLIHSLARRLRPFRFLLPAKDLNAFARRVVMAVEEPGNFLISLSDRLNLDSHLMRLSEAFHSRASRRSSTPPLMIHGVRAMLEQLSVRYPLAIVSARGERSTLEFLEHHQLLSFFKVVVSGQTCQRTKPTPQPVLWAAELMQTPAEACLMVGDTTVDILAGRRAGAQTVGVLCGFGEEYELRRTGADIILPVTSMLTDILLPAM